MQSIRLTVITMTAVCFCQAGCLESVMSTPAANSRRTAPAYPSRPLVETDYADQRVREYTEQLMTLMRGEETPEGAPLQPVAGHTPYVPLLPVDATPVSRQPASPFAADSDRRRVAIPDSTPVRAAAKAVGTFAAQPQAEEGPIEDTFVDAGASEPEPDESRPDPVVEALKSVQQQIEDNPNNLYLQKMSRMLLATAGYEEQALQPIEGLSDEENRQVSDLLRMLLAMQSSTPTTPEEATSHLATIERLREELMGIAELQIPKVKLCKLVDGFGVYEQFDSYEFAAGRSQPVLVYCELKNYALKTDEAGMHHTRLKVALDLYNARGSTAQPGLSIPNVEDISSNKRNDFYLSPIYTLSSSLPPGEYTLKVTIQDMNANKVATNELQLVMKDMRAGAR